MVLFVLYFKANLENVGKIALPPEHEYCIDVKNSAGEDARQGVRVTAAHIEELKDSRGTANFALKWEKDSRKAAYLNVVPVKGYTRTVTAEDDGNWVPLIGFDCRGMDVTGWHPEDGFEVESTTGKKFSDVDLSEGEWVEYDEKLGESVGIYELQHKLEPYHERYTDVTRSVTPPAPLKKRPICNLLDTMDDEQQHIRKINLIEVFKDELEATGILVEEPEDLSTRSEDDIRKFFKQLTLEQQQAAAFPAPPDDDFRKWFPGLALSKTACSPPRWNVLCFPNAGNAEDMYTSEGTGSRRTVSPLLEWCRAKSTQVLAVQLPGRNMRREEKPLTSCQEVAQHLLPIVASRLQSTPYLVIAHSVGCWNAFELLTLARKAGLPMPKVVFLSAMAAPSIPTEQRPWRQQHLLGEDEFKEECRGWDVNELVFSPYLWGTYQPLMRADFTLFDKYVFQHADEPAFTFPLTTFWGTNDRRISEAMIRGWQRFTSGPFECHSVEGHHLWPLDPQSKTKWLQMIVDSLGAA